MKFFVVTRLLISLQSNLVLSCQELIIQLGHVWYTINLGMAMGRVWIGYIHTLPESLPMDTQLSIPINTYTRILPE